MNRLQHQPETSRRVLYFLCHLERCGDEDFVSRLPVQQSPLERKGADVEPDRTLLFSTN